MSVYVYKARDQGGVLESGEIEANSEQAAFDALSERNLVLVKLISKDKIIDWEKISQGSLKVTLSMLMVFTKQFSTMLNAGMSIVESLKTLSEEEINKNFAEIIANIATEVEGGSSLSGAMEKHPKVFSPIYTSMVKVGEASGKLDVIFLKIAKQLEKNYDLKTKIKGAMIYPTFILVTLVAVALLMVTFVIPRLTPILESADVKLPFLTKALIFISEGFLSFWWLIIPGLFILTFLGRLYVKNTKEGNEFWDDFKTRIPVAGKIIKNIYMARMTRTFSTLMAGGVNIVESLEITAQSMGNVNYKKDILETAKEVKNGVSLGDSFKKSQHMSRMVKKMIKVGENTGTMDSTMEKVAIFYEAEVDNSVTNLSKTLEPILIIVMGIGVALVVSSVIMPLYDATRSVGSM